MKKKILIFSIMAVLMLVTISFASAVDTTTSTKKKESPLFKIRVQNAIQEKKQIVQERMHNFFVKLIGDRIFLRIPLICSLERENMLEVEWTKLQPICWK